MIVNCEQCTNYVGWVGECIKPYCKLGKRIMYRISKLPGIKDDPGYRRKCLDFIKRRDGI